MKKKSGREKVFIRRRRSSKKSPRVNWRVIENEINPRHVLAGLSNGTPKKRPAAEGLVEARGVEPLSEDRRLIASTCVADSLSFATTHAYRQA